MDNFRSESGAGNGAGICACRFGNDPLPGGNQSLDQKEVQSDRPTCRRIETETTFYRRNRARNNRKTIQQMRVYIAGKVSGLDRDRAELKFRSTETVLTEKSFEVINPLRLVQNQNEDWTKAMKICIAGMMTADAVYMLPDHVYSAGATIERSIALNIGMPLFYSLDELMKYSRVVRQTEEL